MTGNSRPVYSQQTGISEQLPTLVRKHLDTLYRKPLQPFSLKLFEQLQRIVIDLEMPVILDSGCGNGDSSRQLAIRFPDCLVIGLDKSQHRLNKYLRGKLLYQQDNLLLARADLVDTWRQVATADWHVEQHFLLYPNPWPRPDQVKRRWHGHPVFPALLAIPGRIELRTNWKIYAEEFKQALTIADRKAIIEQVTPTACISPFERKYQASNHSLYRLTT